VPTLFNKIEHPLIYQRSNNAMTKKIALATCSAFANLQKSEASLLPALKELAIDARPVVWDDPNIDWSQYHGCVLRSTWDYYQKYDSFMKWIDKLEAKKIPIWNGPQTIRWNINKKYLFEIAKANMPIVPTYGCPTIWTEKNFEILKKEVASERIIVKPLVGAGADKTYRVSSWEDWHLQVGPNPDWKQEMIAQPYLESIENMGEVSLLYFGTAFIHGWSKKPKPGDFRVQSMFGGEYSLLTPSATESALASTIVQWLQKKLATWNESLCYARLDFIRTPNGPLVSELELIEPDFAFELSPESIEKFARHIGDLLTPLASR
jgi:glutathione synthase/RimK-type ligase-like ATP-grasp enzyme